MKKIIVFLSVLLSLVFTGCSNEDASIGIIGGADGPTAIFVSSSVNWWSIIIEAVIIIAVIVAVILYIKRRKK